MRYRWGLAGILGAGVALGVGELLAGLADGIASPLSAIGGQVVDRSPGFLKDFAVETFGTADKAVLAIGTAVLALVIGWFAGILSRTRRWLIPVVFAAFGLLGLVTALGEVGAVPWMVIASAVIAVAAGVGAFELLVRFPGEPEPTDALAEDSSRRRFLGLAGAVGLAAVSAGYVGRRLIAAVPDIPSDITLPTVASSTTTVPTGSDFAIAGLSPAVVPNEDFYRIDTALVIPRVDPADWKLSITGLVDNEVEFTYDDLLGMDLIEDYVTLACVSNPIGGDLVGNARWTGVPLQDIFDRAGVQASASQVVGRSVDDFTVGFPTEVVGDGRGPMIAVAMNGDPLPAKHGFPARLVVPGLYGYVSATKWLSEIELTTWDGFDAYWVPRGWAKEGPIKTQSRFDTPQYGDRVTAGPLTLAGVAWSPLLGIEAVEVSEVGGDWMPAEISTPVSSHSWVQWKITLDIAPGRHQYAVRATDGTGTPQTDMLTSARPSGATGHHMIVVNAS